MLGKWCNNLCEKPKCTGIYANIASEVQLLSCLALLEGELPKPAKQRGV